MHALGTDHPQVRTVIQGINHHLERMCNNLAGLEATIVVTADHGHITVQPEDMVVLPENIVECLDYANVGVYGKGRHAYLHCKCGLQAIVRERWRSNETLNTSFVLLTIEEAGDLRLLGPVRPRFTIRPRFGDFVAVAVNHKTLVSPKEAAHLQEHQLGAHGSLLPTEMEIPFIIFTPATTSFGLPKQN